MRELIMAEFDGEVRPFVLRAKEIRLLEKECNAGIAAIALRIQGFQFGFDDIRAPILYGLQGGGMSSVDATARVLRVVDPDYLDPFILLASRIVEAVFRPLRDLPSPPGKAPAEMTENPATSPPSTKPES